MSVIPFPARKSHWRRREPVSVRAALAIIAGLSLLFWGLVAACVALVVP